MKQILKWTLVSLGVCGLAGGALTALRSYIEWRYAPDMYALNNAPSTPVAIVFGAGLRRDGSPQPVLYDRVLTAAELYHSGKVQMLLMSGDGRDSTFYNEPEAMRQTALQLGVPDEAILLDGAGLDTYATCDRAHTQFGIEQAVLITQNFHLPRALFLCDAQGVVAQGVSADRRQYLASAQLFWSFRELFATANAVFEVVISRRP